MSDENKVDNKYHTYLEQKHSKFGVKPAVVKAAVELATGATNFESKRIIAGEVNEVYEVNTENDDLIVRISHESEDRFTPEKWAIDKARDLSVPAPEVLYIGEVFDEKKNVRVSVERKLRGTSLEDSKLSEADTRVVVIQAGKILAKIHSITTQKFGRLYEGGVGGHEDWESYMLRHTRAQQIKGLLESAKRIGVLKKKIERALQILIDYSDMYSDASPHLLHGDFGPKHILVDEGHITGIIDFENAKSGDPMHDFAWWSYFEKNRPPLEWLKEGYQKVVKLPDNFKLKLRLYRLRLGMDMIWYYDHEGHELGIQTAKDNLQDDLEFFEKRT
jgi:aminoglycoside phosphotransferase (APT) family kinase protein